MPQTLGLLYSPEANTRGYTFGLHVQARASWICLPNIDVLKGSFSEHWDARSSNYITATCCQGRMEAIIAANVGHTEDWFSSAIIQLSHKIPYM